jgi:hypothetical protein
MVQGEPSIMELSEKDADYLAVNHSAAMITVA